MLDDQLSRREKKMIVIDGSTGEGGGQILRSALGLSLVSGKPFQIRNIRANRKKPGLMRQHLTAVQAAAEIGTCKIDGAIIGSTELFFTPDKIKAGNYHFSIGTAGSCTLVFQAILPALLMTDMSSEVVLEGGTHNPMAPPFDFLETTFLPLLGQMGIKIHATLERPGFFPAGGGKLRIAVTPAKELKPFDVCAFSKTSLSAKAVCAQLPGHIAKRELNVIAKKLHLADADLDQIQLEDYGPGNILTIMVRSEQLTETFTGFGQKNRSAEKVASQTVREVTNYLSNRAPVGPYLADQLLIPMALVGSGSFVTGKPTEHTLTNIEVIQKFLEVTFNLKQLDSKRWEIRVQK